MSDFFREIDEEVRRDQLLATWRKYRVLIIGAVAAVILGVAGFQAWQAYEQRQRVAAAERYAIAEAQLEAGERAQALQRFAQMADPDDKAYGLLAAFELARLAAEDGNAQLALETWGSVAEGSAPQAYRDAAILAAASFRIDQGEVEEGEAMLEPLTEAGRPYRALALELSAVAALAREDLDAARSRLEGLQADIEAPAGTRQRAGEMVGTLDE
ncbi:MAG TPA: tetratricopeptide repeat protein [Kiloniellales bacterium]|nr:tetratricopeptide repeat protein [Kiloniellales bacterium]